MLNIILAFEYIFDAPVLLRGMPEVFRALQTITPLVTEKAVPKLDGGGL